MQLYENMILDSTNLLIH